MSERKFRDTTRGGWHVRNIKPTESYGVYVLEGEVGNHSGEPPSECAVHWNEETWTKYGEYIKDDQSPFDLIEVTK